MRKLAIFLAAVLTLNLAAPAVPAYAAPQNFDTETDYTANEKYSEEITETGEVEVTSENSTESETVESETAGTEETTETLSLEEVESTTEVIEESVEKTTVEETSISEEGFTEEEVLTTEEMSTTEEVVSEEIMENGVNYNEEIVEDVVLSLDTEVTASVGDWSNATWLQYVVEKNGYYKFTVSYDKSYGYIDFYRNNKNGSYEADKYVSTSKASMNVYAKTGDVLYFKAYHYSSEEVTLTAVISELQSVTAVKDENGVYSGIFGDYELQTILTPGYSRIAHKFTLLPRGDNALSGTYNVSYKYRELSSTGNASLSNYNYEVYSASGSVMGVKKNSTYTLDIILMDNSNNVICVFTDMVVTTKDTDKAVEWTIKNITYNSATILCEKIAENVYAYLGKKGTSEKRSLSNGESTYSLESSTEYRIWVEDYDGNLLQEEFFVTKELELDVTYEVTAECEKIIIDASVSAYKGTESGLYLQCSYTSDDGEVITGNQWMSLYSNGEDEGKSGTGKIVISNLLAETSYDIELALSESYYYSGVKYAQETRRVTTLAGDFKAEDVSFTVSQNEATPTTLDYAVVLPERETYEEIDIYYRLVEDTKWTHVTGTTISTQIITFVGSISGLGLGQEYEVKAVIENQGIHKVVSVKLGEAMYHPIISDDTDAFDANLMFELPAEEVSTENSWTVNLLYKTPDTDYFSNIISGLELLPENEYKVELNTVQYLYSNLLPDSKYIFKWELYKDGQLSHIEFQPITTKTVSAKVEIDSIGCNSVDYTVTLLSRMDNLWSSVYIYPKISKKNGAVVSEGKYVYFSSSNKDAKELSVTLPDDNTEYEITLYYNDEPIGETTTFITVNDDRTLTVDKVTSYVSKLHFDTTLSGEAAEENTTLIHFYVREKGKTEWMYHNYFRMYEAGEISHEVTNDIKEETTYEYVVGIGRSEYTTPEYLKEKQSGEVTTPKDDRTLTITEVTERFNGVKFSVSLSGEAAEGIANCYLLYYRKKGTNNAWNNQYNYMYYAGDGSLSVEGSLEENTTYEYVCGIGNAYNTAKGDLKSVIAGEFTTLVDDRALTVSKVEARLNSVEVTVELTGEAAEGSNYILLYYRLSGSEDEWNRKYTTMSGSGEEELTFTGLDENTEYEYVLGLGKNYNTPKDELKNSITDTFCTLEDDRELAVSKVEARLNSVEVTVTLTGKAAEGSNYILLYYRLSDSEDEWNRKYTTISGSKETEITFAGLEENTEYEYILGLGKNSNTPKDELKKCITDTFRTLEDDRELTVNAIDAYLQVAKAKIALSGKAAEGISNRIYFFWKEKGTGSWSYDYEYLYEQGTVTVSTYSDLKENTEYEYVIGISNEWISSVEELKHTKSGEFKTIADDRTLSVSVEPAMQSATFEVVVSGKAAEETWGYVKVFYKEAGSEIEDYTTIYYDGQGTYEQTVWSYDGSELKEDTEYEYVIGYANDYDDSKEKLKQVINGSFKTLQDTRKLVNAGCEAGYENARLSATVINNTFGVYTYIYYFVRPKGAEYWECYTDYGGTNNTMDSSILINNLEQQAEYEYVVVLSDNYNLTSPDEVLKETQKAYGTFTTKASKYQLSVIADESKCTYSKGYVNVTASGDNSDERLYVTLHVSDGIQTYTEDVILSQAQGYKNTAIFTGLSNKTEYMVTKAVISVEEYGNRIAISEISEFDNVITFMTKELIVPQTLKLPVEELYLNVAGGGAFISEQTLSADVTPANAVKAFYWTSDNENVATVSNGYIKAVGSGTATITVSSAFNPELKDTCKVVVKDYVIGRETETGMPEIISGSIDMYKGEVLKGYALYEIDAEGKFNKVEGMNVSVERSLVAEWTEEGLHATGTGSSKVYFEANGVKAILVIYVLDREIGFGLVGLDSADSTYPAVCTGDGVYTIANKDGLTYTVVGEIVPDSYFNAAAFEWTSSDESIATVENGVIRPVAEGNAIITAIPVAEPSPYVQNKASITINVKDVPQQGESIPTVYALINTKNKMTLEDVEFPVEWGTGWSWRDPKTPLYTLPVHQDCYAFEASYTGDDLYPYEGLVNVYISKIENVYAYEVGAEHNHVIEVDENDSILLRIESEHMGMVPSNYRYNFAPVDGLTIAAADNGGYLITAQKAGKYNLIPTIEFYEADEAGKEVVAYSMAGKGYSIKATDKAQVNEITLSCVDENFEITEEVSGEMIKVNFTEEMKGKKFTLTAEVLDKQGKPLDSTGLQWKITDKTVATVSYKKTTSHKAEITVKGTGHAILSVTACDDTAFTTQLDVEIRDYKPRINTNKAKVNIAYDYMNYSGMELAYENYGLIEIVGVYEDVIENIRVVKNNDMKQIEKDLELYQYGDYSSGVSQFIVVPTREEIDTGKYDCLIEVETRNGEEPYYYPMTVTVVDEAPKVSAKMGTNVNLFYLNEDGTIYFDIKGMNYGIENVTWGDKASIATGFEVSSYVNWDYNKGKYYSYVSHDDVKVINRKPVDSQIANGTLTVSLYGVRKPIEIKNFKIKYVYKKPTLEAKNATTSIAPTVGNQTAGFYIYDKLNKSYLNYRPNSTSNYSYYYYEMNYDNDYVDSYPSGSYVYTTYYGTKTSETVSYTLYSRGWREPLAVKQTIKTVAPKATLSPSTLTYNKAYKSAVSTSVYVGNVSSFATPEWLDLEVKGADKKAKALVENGIFDITRGEYAQSPITVTLNQTNLMDLDGKDALKAGTYKFKVTPHYRKQNTGVKMKLNTLNLTIKVVDKPVTVKVAPKGSLDITMSTNNDYMLYLKSDFKNLGQDYLVTGAKLKGEYSKYFNLVRYYSNNYSPGNYYYLQLSENNKVKAGHTYKLSVEYTLMTPSGDTLTVQSNVFTVKPKQSAPKVSVYKNDQIIYAAANMSRGYEITLPYDYWIQDISGGLDCNKDGCMDIVLTNISMDDHYGSFMVTIIDKDAVVATQKGKSYTIPVTVSLVGRDGISKDAKVNIKVKVKR